MIRFTKAAGSSAMEIAPPLFLCSFSDAYFTYTSVVALDPEPPPPPPNPQASRKLRRGAHGALLPHFCAYAIRLHYAGLHLSPNFRERQHSRKAAVIRPHRLTPLDHVSANFRIIRCGHRPKRVRWPTSLGAYASGFPLNLVARKLGGMKGPGCRCPGPLFVPIAPVRKG